jgi:hypothetical protein
MVLSIEERVFLAEYVFREGTRYTDLVQEQFSEKFPETLCTSSQYKFVDLLRNFFKTDSVLGAERSGRPSKINDKMLIDISDSMLRSPSK